MASGNSSRTRRRWLRTHRRCLTSGRCPDARQESHHKAGCVKRPARGLPPQGCLQPAWGGPGRSEPTARAPSSQPASPPLAGGTRGRASSLDGQPPPPCKGHPTLREDPRRRHGYPANAPHLQSLRLVSELVSSHCREGTQADRPGQAPGTEHRAQSTELTFETWGPGGTRSVNR